MRIPQAKQHIQQSLKKIGMQIFISKSFIFTKQVVTYYKADAFALCVKIVPVILIKSFL